MHRSRSAVPAALLSTLCSILFSSLFISAGAHAADSTRALPAFIAVDAKGAFAMTVEVGETQSVVVSGDEKFVKAVKTEVVDKELRITVDEQNYKGNKSDPPRIAIKLPSLSRVKVAGAGETIISKVNTDRLDIGYLGAGHLVASGQVKYLRLNARGVGQVETRELRAQRVDVNFEGVGEVDVYASELLNAVARGMGSLTYYGRPKTVNKSAAGLGRVSAGD